MDGFVAGFYLAVDVAFVGSAVGKNADVVALEDWVFDGVSGEYHESWIYDRSWEEGGWLAGFPVVEFWICCCVTFFDGFLYDSFWSEGGRLEHFLEADYIIVINDVEYFLESLFFVVVLIGLDGGRSEEDVEGE